MELDVKRPNDGAVLQGQKILEVPVTFLKYETMHL